MMAQYIDAEELVTSFEEADAHERWHTFEVVDKIEAFPTADVAGMKHGKWIGSIDFPIMQAMIRCSLCNEPSITMSKFCPNCGAKMDGGSE